MADSDRLGRTDFDLWRRGHGLLDDRQQDSTAIRFRLQCGRTDDALEIKPRLGPLM